MDLPLARGNRPVIQKKGVPIKMTHQGDTMAILEHRNGIRYPVNVSKLIWNVIGDSSGSP